MNRIKKIFKPRLKLVKGTRLTSFLFIGISIAIAAGILFAANIYYNLDTGEIVLEQIQRVTQIIRATAGLVVGGTPTSTLPSGVALEIATTSAVRLSGSNQELRFTGGTNYYVGLKAPTNLSASSVYTLPSAYPSSSGQVLQSTTDGTLSWLDLGAAGYGDILAVGDCLSGECFTQTSTSTSLWFYNSNYRGQLTVGTLTANRTYTLPDLTGTFALSSGALTNGSVLFASNGLISQDNANFFWDNSAKQLKLGGTLAIKEGGTSPQYYTIFQGGDQSANITYTLPIDAGSANYVLYTDGSGNLFWGSVAGGPGGAIGGSGTANRVAKWQNSTTLTNAAISDTATSVVLTLTDATTTIANNLTVSGTGIHSFAGILDPNQMDAFTLIGNITGSGSPNITGIGNFSAVTAVLSTSVTSPLYTSSGALTIQSGSGDITIDPASGIIQLGTSDYIKTSGGYEIGKAGTQILRGIVPIFGFDLPTQCSTACDNENAQISRTIEDYPFPSALSGTTRKHKLIIRYATSDTTTAINFRVYDETASSFVDQGGGNYDISVSASPSNDLEKGVVAIANVVLPATSSDDWHLTVRGASGLTSKIYQIFLGAYDEIQ